VCVFVLCSRIIGKMNKILLSVAVFAVAVSATFPYMTYGDDNNEDMIYLGTRPAYDETQFAGKNILVTGGSSGIGFATALTFARFGSNVVIVSRDSNPDWFTGAQAVAKIEADDIVQAKGGKIRWYKCDVADRDQVKSLFKQFVDDKFMLDYAVNNAGIVGAVGNLKDTEKYLGTEHDAVRNNLQGTVNTLEEEIAQFHNSGKDGAIVNLASVNGYRASPGGALYATSKFGIVGLTRSVGTEYARGTPLIRVNAIAPGFTNTSLVWQQTKLLDGSGRQTWEGEYVTPSSDLWKQYASHFQSLCPTGDLADPMDQANMIAFLLSDSASLITGSIFTVDGLIGEK